MRKVLSFDIGATNSRLALINENFEIEKVVKLPTVKNLQDKFLDNLDTLIANFNLDEVEAFGVGIPGVYRKEDAYIIDMPNAFVKDIPLGEYIANKYHKKVYMRNDAEMACLAEACIGKGKNYSRVFFITISSGLGGAMTVDKEIQDYIHEIGHTAYKYKGVWTEYEHLASGNYIPDLAKLNNLEVSNSKEFFTLLRANDPLAKTIFADWLNILSDFIEMIVNSYHPDIITVTGGVMKEKDIFFDELISRNKEVEIVECGTKEDAGLIGGAIYAFKQLNNK